MEGKQGDGVPEPADGDLAGHGDGGGVDQFFHAGPTGKVIDLTCLACLTAA